MTAAAKKLRCTPDDLLAIPESERRHELIDGELIEKANPSGEHGSAQAHIAIELGGPFDRRPGADRPGGWWFATEVEIALPSGDIVRPDVVGWRRDRVAERPSGTPVAIVPDWVCEILSTNRGRDLIRKKRVYHRAKIRHYWIVDPAEWTLSVNRWAEEGYLEVLSAERGERVRAEPFDAIELSVGALFGEDDGDG
jgi:Uma2 family endonuclease